MIHDLKKYAPTSKTLFLFSAFLLFVIFLTPLKSSFDKLIVTPIFSKVSSSLLKDFIFIFICIGITWKMLKDAFQRKLISEDWIILSIFYTIMYLSTRIGDEKYSYTSFYIFQSIKYADTTMLVIIIFWVIRIRDLLRSTGESIYNDSPFLVDVPLSKGIHDDLNRQKFAMRIADRIQSKPKTDTAGSLAIGITGEWGSGKTSFSNMIKEALDLESRIVIHFNPWRSSSPEKIIEDFFELLISELKPYDYTLSRNIYSYAKTLTKVHENIITKGIQAIGEIFDDSSKNEIYKDINESISKIKRQIIIFVDDLDRLDKKEIIGVLRLIRNTANFNNLVYVAAYDKTYVLEAVKDFNESNYLAFLEKIFQFEFVLPYYSPEIIRNYLKAQLKSALPDAIHSDIDWSLDSRSYKGLNITNVLIQNHRTAIRLANALVFEIEEVIHDVFFYDFYLIQIFKLKYLAVFNLLFENSNIFLVTETKNNNTYYRLRLEHEKTLDNDTIQHREIANFLLNDKEKTGLSVEEKAPLFNKYLEENSKKFHLSESDKFHINAIIAELLDIDRAVEGEHKNQRYKTFAKTENFHKYFAYQLEDGEVPASVFELARRQNYGEYLSQIEGWKSENSFDAFSDRVSKIEFFANVLEFENQVQALFEIGKTYASKSNIYGYDFSFLISTLRYPMEDLKDPPTKLYTKLADYQIFLRKVFGNNKFPKSFENRLITLIQTQGNGYFPLSNEELAEISLTNLKDHINKDLGLENQFWNTYHNTKIWIPENHLVSRHPEAEQMATDYYKKKQTECTLGGFITQVSGTRDYFYLNEESTKFAFSSMIEFETWFKTAENIDKTSNCYIEFKAFFEANTADLPNGTKWEFKYITPERHR